MEREFFLFSPGHSVRTAADLSLSLPTGFGALPGSSFTIHQVQHISIALMFFFGGGMGLLLESTLARKLLAAPVAIMDGRGFRSIEKPPTWSGSFNPFPALVIGVVSRTRLVFELCRRVD